MVDRCVDGFEGVVMGDDVAEEVEVGPELEQMVLEVVVCLEVEEGR